MRKVCFCGACQSNLSCGGAIYGSIESFRFVGKIGSKCHVVIGEKMMETVRKEIADLIGIDIRSTQSNVSYTVLESVQEDGYIRKKIT